MSSSKTIHAENFFKVTGEKYDLEGEFVETIKLLILNSDIRRDAKLGPLNFFFYNDECWLQHYRPYRNMQLMTEASIIKEIISDYELTNVYDFPIMDKSTKLKLMDVVEFLLNGEEVGEHLLPKYAKYYSQKEIKDHFKI